MPKLRSQKKQSPKVTLKHDALRKLGLETENPGAFCGEWLGSGKPLQSISPIDGRTIASERPQHRMLEQWQPLGIVGIVTAFNFPVAVWAWNSALAAVCGDSTVWKPSSQTPLSAIATTKIAEGVCRANQVDPAIF